MKVNAPLCILQNDLENRMPIWGQPIIQQMTFHVPAEGKVPDFKGWTKVYRKKMCVFTGDLGELRLCYKQRMGISAVQDLNGKRKTLSSTLQL